MSLIDRFEGYLSRFGIYGTAIGIVWGFMSWAASHITPLSGYGWGTFVFVGFGAACFLILVLSAAAVAWRYFHPIAPKNPKAGKAEPVAALDPEIGRDLLLLLYFAAHQSTLTMLNYLIDRIPERYNVRYDAPLPVELANQAAYHDATIYLDSVRNRICDGSDRAREYERIWHNAEAAAERQLRDTPQDERPSGIDPLLLRDYSIAFRRAVWTANFLRAQKLMLEESMIVERNALIERLGIRNQ